MHEDARKVLSLMSKKNCVRKLIPVFPDLVAKRFMLLFYQNPFFFGKNQWADGTVALAGLLGMLLRVLNLFCMSSPRISVLSLVFLAEPCAPI